LLWQKVQPAKVAEHFSLPRGLGVGFPSETTYLGKSSEGYWSEVQVKKVMWTGEKST
jgi:hypothetical protein